MKRRFKGIMRIELTHPECIEDLKGFIEVCDFRYSRMKGYKFKMGKSIFEDLSLFYIEDTVSLRPAIKDILCYEKKISGHTKS